MKAAYTAEITRARSQRWVAIPDHERLRAIEATIVRMAADGQTPENQRELNRELDLFAEAYTELAGTAASAQTPSGFSAPVFDAAGQVTLAISVQGLTRLAPADLRRCRSSLLTMAAELTCATRLWPRE